jgi:hypothetical protein
LLQVRLAEVVMSTTWEQLEGAALSLARSGPIKDRLTDAYRNHLAYVKLEELPDALREEFRACHDALTRERPLRGEDAVRATVRKLSATQADELACSVVRLFAAVARESFTAAAHAGSALQSDGAALNGTLLNGFAAATPRLKSPKVLPPQVISLYAAEA